MDTLLVTQDGAITNVTLNRPDVHNAFNEDMMSELKACFTELAQNEQARVVVIRGAGKSFCAGGDLNYMKSASAKTQQQNIDESLLMAGMFKTIDELNKPTIAVVHGAVLGGGMGLLSICDIALAHEKTQFGLSEVKLGLTPSVISPFVMRKIGISWARRFFVTGERFDAAKALQMGLIHEIVTDDNQATVLKNILAQILANGPHAVAQAKTLTEKNQELSGEVLTRFTAEHIAGLRAGAEAQEGMAAFLEKRKPGWCA